MTAARSGSWAGNEYPFVQSARSQLRTEELVAQEEEHADDLAGLLDGMN